MQAIKGENLTWIDIKNPQDPDVRWLKKRFRFHPLVLKEILPPIDYPKIENFGDYLFITIFYPYFDRETSSTVPFELDIIVGKDFLVTVHYKDIVPLKAVFDKCNLYKEIREEYTDEGSGELLYRIIRGIFQACFPKLGHIKDNINEIEADIFNKEYRESVNRISLVKRDIIGFQRIISPQKIVLEKLIEESEKFFGKKLTPYFHNLLSQHDQINGILKTQYQTLFALDSTNESLLTNRTNEIIKILTLFSVVVFPLTLLAAIFGMNTDYLPFVGKEGDFWIITGIMLGGMVLMLGFFKFKKWI